MELTVQWKRDFSIQMLIYKLSSILNQGTMHFVSQIPALASLHSTCTCSFPCLGASELKPKNNNDFM